MTEDEFLASSYIMQKNQNSLLTLPPAEQLRFIERLAFGNDSPDVYKDRISNKINYLNSSLTAINSRLGVLSESLINLHDQLPEEQLSPKQDVDFAKIVEDKKITLQSVKKRIEALQAVCNAHQSCLDEMSTIRSKADAVKAMERDILAVGDLVPVECDVEELEKSINLYENLRQVSVINRRIAEAVSEAKQKKKQIETLRTSVELDSNDSLITSTESHILTLQKEYEQYAEFVALEPRLVELTGKRFPFSYDLHEIEMAVLGMFNSIADKDLEIAQTQAAIEHEIASVSIGKTLHCPECQEECHLQSGELITGKYDGNGDQRLTDLKNKLKSLKAEMSELVKDNAEVQSIAAKCDSIVKLRPFYNSRNRPSVEEVENQVIKCKQTLAQYKEEKKQILGEMEELAGLKAELQALSFECNSSAKTVNKLLTEIPDAFKTILESQDAVSVEEKLAQLKASLKQANDYHSAQKHKEDGIAKITAQKQALSTQFKKLKDSLPADYESSFKELKELKCQFEELLSSLEEYREALDKERQEKEAESMLRTQRELLLSEIAKTSISKTNAEQELKETSERLKNTILFKELSDKAQMAAISDVIDSLNISAKEYLDVMFQDSPISVSLKPFKENKDKSVKPKLSLSINYKGFDLDSITEDVSGGENDRIILAYQLAMNSIYNSPILLLDEPFTGLNQALVDVVIESLRLTAQNKLVICISHGINKGLFDEVIEI
jgi:DNA repair exonuclease SbcCD ATPase subunit